MGRLAKIAKVSTSVQIAAWEARGLRFKKKKKKTGGLYHTRQGGKKCVSDDFRPSMGRDPLMEGTKKPYVLTQSERDNAARQVINKEEGGKLKGRKTHKKL